MKTLSLVLILCLSACVSNKSKECKVKNIPVDWETVSSEYAIKQNSLFVKPPTFKMVK